jgi:hypothetical protein
MKLLKKTFAATALILSISGVASASTYHGSTSSDNLEQYSQDFTTTDFSVDHFFNKYYFGFDALVTPADDFKITSATLTIDTKSNGLFDTLYAYDNGYLTAPAAIKHGGLSTYTLGASLFDDILAGIDFKAWFTFGLFESITKATLSVKGEYATAPSVSEVPLPAAAFLFAPALLGFMGLRRKAKNTIA